MMMFHTCMLWYDTLYDDNACTLYDVDALLYNMMYTHTIVWWCSPMHYDVYLMMMMHKRYTLRRSWCIFDDEDAYPMTMMPTYDDDAWRCMPYVQWKKRRITCWVIVYDEVYNDVYMSILNSLINSINGKKIMTRSDEKSWCADILEQQWSTIVMSSCDE